MGFRRETTGDDENLSIRFEQAVDLSHDVVGIAFKLPFGNGPFRLRAKSLPEDEIVNLPGQNDEVQRPWREESFPKESTIRK